VKAAIVSVTRWHSRVRWTDWMDLTLDRRGPRMSSLTAQLSRCVVATPPFPFSRSALRLCPIGGTSHAAPVPRGLAWLRSAWPAIVERWLLLGPRRRGEDDFSLLSRLGYYHDDRYGEDFYGWMCSGDVGWPADYLGGRIFQPLSLSQLDAAWAHRMWHCALQRVQATLMGPAFGHDGRPCDRDTSARAPRATKS